jgi:kynurenine aminotransferase
VTRHNPVGKVYSREELQAIGDLCVKHNILILSDEVYDRLYYVPFTRIATLSPEISKLTLTVGSAGKNFYATGWRVGYLIGEPHLIKYVAAAHTRICYSSVSPLQEATAIGFEQADKVGFWDQAVKDMKGKMKRFNEVWDELGLPVMSMTPLTPFQSNTMCSTLTPKAATSFSSTFPKSAYQMTISFLLM